MQQEITWLDWLKRNRSMAIEALRIYLGACLFIKGIQFVTDGEHLSEYVAQVTIPFFDFLSLHVVALIHISGGLLMAIGLITRVAALIQVPVMLGAIFFVHLQQGLFTKAQTLEFVILVLFLLLVFAVYGSGALSVDAAIERRLRKK